MQLQGGWLDLAGRLAVVDCPATHSCFLPVRPDLNLDLHLNLDLDLDLDLNWGPLNLDSGLVTSYRKNIDLPSKS